LPIFEKSKLNMQRIVMKNILLGLVNFYSVALFGFLVFIRKGFLQMRGDGLIPVINISEIE
jgi:hypothetical protein